jgi:hypothetical protein
MLVENLRDMGRGFEDHQLDGVARRARLVRTHQLHLVATIAQRPDLAFVSDQAEATLDTG